MAIPFSLGIAEARLNVDYSGLSRGMRDAERAFDSGLGAMSQKVASFGRSVRDAGFSLVAITAPLNAFTGIAVKTASGFEKSLRNIEALGGLTADQIGAISEKAQQLGRDTIFAASDALGAFEDMIKDGRTVAESLASIDTILNVAAATNLNLAETQTYVSDTLDIFGLSAENAAEAAQTLVSAAFTSPATFEEIALSLRNAGVSANTLGIPLEDVSAALVILARQGQRGAEAGTKLRQFFDYLKPTTEKAALAMQQIGVDAFDAEGNFIGLGKVIEQFKKGLDGLSTEEQKDILSDIFGIRAAQAAQLLINYDMTLAEIKETMGGVGLVAEIARMQMDTFDGSVKSLKGSFEIFMIKAATPFMKDILRPLVQLIIPVVNEFSSWAQRNPALTKTILALGAVVGGLGVALIAIGQGLVFAAPGLALIGGLFGALVSPIGLLIGALGLLSFAVATNIFDIRRRLGGLAISFGTWLQGLGGGFEKVGDLILGIVNRPLWDNLKLGLKKVLGDTLLVDMLGSIFKGAGARLKAEGLSNWVEIVKDMFNLMGNAFEYYADEIPILNWARSIINRITGVFRDSSGEVYAFWQDPIGAISTFVSDGVASIVEAIGIFFADPVGTIKNVGVWALEFLTGVVSAIGDVLGDAGQWISVIGDEFGNIATEILAWIKENIINKIFGSVADEAAQTFRDPSFQYSAASGVDYVNIFSKTLTPDSATTGGLNIVLPNETKQTIKAFVIGWIDSIVDTISSTFFNVKSWVIAGGIGDTFQSVLNFISSSLTTLLFGPAPEPGTLNSRALDLNEQKIISDWAKSNINSIGQKISQSFTDTKNWVASIGVGAAFQSVPNLISSSLTTLLFGPAPEPGTLNSRALDLNEQKIISDWAKSNINSIGQKISQSFTDTKNWVASIGVGAAFQSVLDFISSSLTTLLFGPAPEPGTLNSRALDLNEQKIISDWAKSNINSIGQKISQSFTDTKNWVASIGVGAAFQSVLDFISSNLITLLFGPAPEPGTLNTRTLSMSQQEIINNWAKANINIIGQKISEAFSDVKTWVTSIAPDFGSIRTSITLALSNLFGTDTSLESIDDGMFQTQAAYARRGRSERMKIVAEEIADIDAQLMETASDTYADELFRRRKKLEEAQTSPTALGAVASVLTGARAAAFAATAGVAAASVTKLPKLPALTPVLLAGRLGRTVKAWASGMAVGLATTAVYYLAPAFGVQLGIQGFVAGLVGQIAGAFDKALGTDYISGSEYQGKIHEWAMNNGEIIHGIITTGLGVIFRAKFLSFFGIAQIVAGIIRSDIDSISDQPGLQEVPLRERIATKMAGIETSILDAVSSFTGGGTQEEDALSPFAVQLQTILDPLFGISGSLTTSTFDLLERLPAAGGNIRQFVDNVIGEPGAERNEATTTFLDSIINFLSQIGKVAGDAIILFTEIPTNIATPLFTGGFRGSAADAIEQVAKRPAQSLLSAGALFAIGTAIGGPVVGAIAGFIGLNLPQALVETLEASMSEEELAKAGITKDSVIASGIIGAIGGAVAGAATGNPILAAAGAVIGGAIGLGTRDGLVNYFTENPLIAGIGGALFGAQFLSSFFVSMTTKQKMRRSSKLKGAAGASIVAMLAPEIMQAMSGELDPEAMTNLVAGLAGGIVGAAIFGIYGAAIGVAIGKFIAPAMWDTFRNAILTDEEGVAAGLSSFEQGLSNITELASSTLAFAGGAQAATKTMGAMGTGQFATQTYMKTGSARLGALVNKAGPLAARFKGVGGAIGGIIAFFAADYFANNLGPQLTRAMEGMDEIDPGEFIKLQAAGAVVGGVAGAILGTMLGVGPVIGGVIGMTAGQAFFPAFTLALEQGFASVNIGDWNLGEAVSQIASPGALGLAGAVLIISTLFGFPVVGLFATLGIALATILVDAFTKHLWPAISEALVDMSILSPLLGIGGSPTGELNTEERNEMLAAQQAQWEHMKATAIPTTDINIPISPITIPTFGGGGFGIGGAATVGGRDFGGPGTAGMPYLIGRRAQPELFVPNSAGQFYPNADKMMQQGDTYQVTINAQIPAGADADTFGSRLGAAFRRQVDRR